MIATVTFNGVTVSDATNISSKPKVTAESPLPVGPLKVKDLVIGKGDAATADSTVSVQYVGVRYADGKQFDSSWERGGPTSFSLKQVVKGFTQGIGGKDEIAPMKLGGRRIIIVPSEMGYGENGALRTAASHRTLPSSSWSTSSRSSSWAVTLLIRARPPSFKFVNAPSFFAVPIQSVVPNISQYLTPPDTIPSF